MTQITNKLTADVKLKWNQLGHILTKCSNDLYMVRGGYFVDKMNKIAHRAR